MSPAVYALIIANVIAYGLMHLFGQAAIDLFALWPYGEFPIRGGGSVGFAPWQLVTYAFLHDPDNIVHIALNLYALYAFGGEVERTLGTRRFVWVYGASVIAAGLCQLIVVTLAKSSGIAPTLGASGGVFGVLLAFGLLFPHRRVMLIIPPIPMPAWVLVTLYAAMELANGVFRSNTGIAHFAHLGGMIGAFIALSAFGYKRFQDTRRG
ncbi:MAG: rhomboid family intramembrane serine protease [Steroidobacteraceae bacterium]|nr:rhomboid family intramembrane serine protease [Steroidobacteraceae bacterium]